MKRIFAILSLYSLSSFADCGEMRKELEKVTFTPFVADGKLVGWAIKNTVRSSQLRGVGFQENDVIVKMGNKPVQSKETLRRAIAKLCDGEPTVEVARRGKNFTLMMK